MNMVDFWYNYYWRYCGRAFGEIEDEHDLDEELIEKNWEMILIFFGSIWRGVSKSNLYKLNIPESDSYGTLGGFIVDFTNDIPLKEKWSR
jgi:CBS domain containing-hemolysin-like protein